MADQRPDRTPMTTARDAHSAAASAGRPPAPLWPSDSRPAYAGIGSRQTPAAILEVMGRAARMLAEQGWVLRTGLAAGADQTFYLAARSIGPVELFLPWPSFEREARDPGAELATRVLERPTAAARQLAEKHHPAWGKLSDGVRALHARNGHQILGPRLLSPVRFVLCWTPDGSLDGRGRNVGGTGQALRLADQQQITVLNLARMDDERRVLERLGRGTAQPAA